MKKTGKKTLAAILSAAMILVMAACGTSNPSSTSTTSSTAQSDAQSASSAVASSAAQSTASGKYKVAFICKSYSDTFCLSVKDYFTSAAKQYADLFTVDYFDSQNTSATQISQIETCTASGYNAIVFQQVDAEAPVQVVKAALDKGVKVIVTTGHIEDNGASWYIDANPHQQGQVVADYAIKQGSCDNAEVAILSGPVGNFHSDNRVAAFKEAVGKVSSAKIVATEVCDWQKDKAMTTTQNMLVAHPNLKVILAANDDMALGALEAIGLANKKDQIKVYAIDGTQAGLEAVKSGSLCATVKQDSKKYADEAIKMTADLLNGKDAKSMKIDSALVTKDNVSDFLK